MPCAIVDRLVGCSLYFCYGHGPGVHEADMSISRPGVLRAGCFGICLSSRWACISVPSPSPCPYADLRSFLVDLGTVRTFSCSMMNVANNGKKAVFIVCEIFLDFGTVVFSLLFGN